MDCSFGFGQPAFRNVLGDMMDTQFEEPGLLDVVALLADLPKDGLSRGQVGTVVDLLGSDAVLVEFSDDSGRAHVVVPCSRSALLVLHYMSETV
jgi:hypothetical protein